MPRRLLRSLDVVALLGSAATGTAGCATACPAVGYINTAPLDVSAFSDVETVQFCVETECSPVPGEGEASSTNLFMVTPQDDGTWTLGFDMSAPDVVEIRLFDAQNTLIHESEQSISWTHSKEPCGGPSEAEPLILEP